MRQPLRIAVLEADTPLPNTEAQYGGYGGVFEALLKAGAKSLEAKGGGGRPDLKDLENRLQISKHQIVVDPENYPDLDTVDAILITGSKHDSFADTPWIIKLVDFTKTVLAQDRVRLIGVCFGHQIIGRALGVKVGRNDKGWEAAVHQVQLSDTGRKIFGKDVLNIHQMHRDIVFEYPKGVQELGYSPVCQVQGMYVPKKLFTIQGHPEFNAKIIQEILESRHKIGVFDDEAFAVHSKKVNLDHDGVAVSRAFLEFLLD